ncbi:LysR family transcriptional regulator [Subtercola frigoramans]|uniref:DNA-binding transcriptional LysR family regulator n=1 Tax=Subtercola frigoramans TaxID=120298 RepID=A0ABS2L976_9MICO|nr:LysR family transcriptional regulator [Subtercola frigoramans]MBM7473640.1 DNA-binding transcriptional LysR family regulator [Subtercola frigoramans]
MDLRQLRYVVTVAQEGGFRPAARELHIAQPPLSTAIRHLEIELGTKLFERSKRGVVPTTAGWELVVRAREILAQVDGARDAVRQGGSARKPIIRVAVLNGELAGGELTAPIMAALRARFDGAEIVLHETTFVDQVDELRNGKVDFAFVRPPIVSSDLTIVPIAQEPRCLVVGVNHPLAEAESVSIDETLKLPMLGLSAPPSWAQMWQLDDLRGGPLIDDTMGPARTVSGAQLALASGHPAITMTKSTMRFSPSPLVTSVNVEGLTPSVFAVAYRKSDTRRMTRVALDVIAVAAAENIHLVMDGELLS